MMASSPEPSAAPQKIARKPYFRGSIILTLVFLTGLLLVVEKRLPHVGFVQELTVGGGVIADADKLRDLRFAPLAIGVQLAVLVTLTLGRFSLSTIGTVCSGLLAAGAAYYLLSVLPYTMPLLLFLALALTAGASYHLSPRHWQEISGHIILAAVGAVLIVHHLFGADPAWALVVALPGIAAATLASGQTMALWISMAGAVVVAIVVLSSAPVFWLNGPEADLSLLDLAHVVIALAVLAQAGGILREAMRHGITSIALPSIGVALAILLLTVPGIWSPAIPVDDYHFGERLLAAQALFVDGGWFASFFSPHGLSDAAGSVVAWLQGDFTGAGIVVGSQLFKWYGVALLIWLFVNRLGPVAAAGFALVLPIWWTEQAFFLIFNLVLAAEAMALRRASLAGALGATVAAAGVFLNAGLGAAAAIVAGVAGLILHWQRGPRDLVLFAASGVATGLIVVALFRSEVAGMVHFLRVSAATNLTIYGNGDFSAILQNPRHFLYVLSPILAFALTGGIWAAAQRDRMEIRVLVALIAPGTLLALLLNQYAAARLDGDGSRGLIVSTSLLVFLPVWLSLFQDQRRAPMLISAICILLVLPVTQNTINIRPTLLPPAPMGQRLPIAEEIPRLGEGNADPAHLAMLREVREVVETILDPGETFLNFTNRNSFYFYFERPIPVPVASAYNAAPEAFQGGFLAALGDTPPPLALVQIANFEWDGLGLPLRSHHLYTFLMENYQPFLRGNFVYGIRNDLVSRMDRLPPEEERYLAGEQAYRIGEYNDVHWQNGIAIGANAEQWSFALPPALTDLLRPGDNLVFSDGIERRVIRAEGSNVRTEPTISLAQANEGAVITFSLAERELLSSNLWARAFHQSQLDSIPSAWGRSMDHLASSIRVIDIQPKILSVSDAVAETGTIGKYTISEQDPNWVFTLPKPVLPAEAGVLAMTISCKGTDSPLHVQLFWRSSTGTFSEEVSLRFTASFVNNLVPLDSSPHWRILPDIAEIKVKVSQDPECDLISMNNIALYARKPLARD